MAIIDHTIPKTNYQLIFDNIAAILLDELAEQYNLSGNGDLNISKIWKNRRTQFNPSEFPTINLTLSSARTTAKFQKQVDKNVIYYIDLYTSKASNDGFNGDERSAESGFDTANVIDYILSYPNYRTLNGFPNVKHTEITDISQGEVDSDGGTKCMVVRLELTVSTINTAETIAPTPLNGNDTEVKLDSTEKGYFYTLNF